jgi:hypothetical protein
MPTPRQRIVDEDAVRSYHLISRCVRQNVRREVLNETSRRWVATLTEPNRPPHFSTGRLRSGDNKRLITGIFQQSQPTKNLCSVAYFWDLKKFRDGCHRSLTISRLECRERSFTSSGLRPTPNPRRTILVLLALNVEDSSVVIGPVPGPTDHPRRDSTRPARQVSKRSLIPLPSACGDVCR